MAQQVLLRTREMQLLEHEWEKPIDVLLHELYITRGLTIGQVASELGLNPATVWRWLDRYGIRRPRRPRKR